jgi:phytoene dehydrogenase-like protein
MHLLSSFSTYIRKYFKHPKILSLLEFPVLFLGAMPNETPALYSLMNYADISLGTWYPMGGMYKFVEAFEKIAKEQISLIKEISAHIEGINSNVEAMTEARKKAKYNKKISRNCKKI